MNNQNKLILCLDGAEARILRNREYKCITASRMRRQLGKILSMQADNALEVATDAIQRLDGISTAAPEPKRWGMWDNNKFKPFASDIAKAFKDIPDLPTPLCDPDDVIELDELELWPCSGTTVLIGKNTSELVRVADTYARYDCYRRKGRMDEPFTPKQGRVCLVSEDELRLLRFENLTGPIEIILTHKPESMTGKEETPPTYPTPIRAICAEHPSIQFGIATGLAAPRCGFPFFIGLTRGVGYETSATTDIDSPGALDYCIETDLPLEKLKLKVVMWAGGNKVHELIRYGGLSIFIGGDRRRKVWLRSLGLIKSTKKLAGAYTYDLVDNYDILNNWAITNTFHKPPTSMRDRNKRRRRSKTASPEYTRGTYNNKLYPPGVLTSRARSESYRLKNMLIRVDERGGGVSTVPLKHLSNGGLYYLNGRSKLKDGYVITDSKRCKIRCPRWDTAHAEELLEHLEEEDCVIMSGVEASGKVFALVKVANGTEDQQRMAVSKWCEDIGVNFPHVSGCPSWVKVSIELSSSTHIQKIFHTDWMAQSLKTDTFEQYITVGEYQKPLKSKRRGVATPLERARVYTHSLKDELREEGARNSRFSSALFNLKDKFGPEIVEKVLPELMQLSTLPEKEKLRMASRILNETTKKEF